MHGIDAMPTSASPMLSVIITCWNYETYVVRAIRSVVSQADPRCELVVIDDGSSDGSWNAILGEGVTAYRIDNSGQRLACIYGLDRTRAPFVLFLDADDELAPGSIATILARLDPDVAKLQFSLTRIDSNGRVISSANPRLDAFRDRKNLAERILRTGVYTTPPTTGNVFRRDVCDHVRNASYDTAVDGVILFVAPFMGDVISLPDELGRYRIHDRNDSGLGQVLSSTSLHRDLRRFVDRMNHLRQILATSGYPEQLVRPEETFFYLERSFYLAVVEGRRVSSGHLKRLLRTVWAQSFSLGGKLSMCSFLVLTAMLPNHRALRGLTYRLGTGRRSAVGLLQALF